jgi:hypothetical protein
LYSMSTILQMKIISQLNKRGDAAVTQPAMYYTDIAVLRLAKQAPSCSAFHLRALEADRFPSGQTTDGTPR